MNTRSILAALVALGTLVAACGGATNPPATTGGTGANACFPVKGRCPDEATSLNGAGATFPAVIYTKWIDEYDRLTGVQINYQSIGSGGGIKSISDRTVDFGATDGPMTDQQLADAKAPILHIPMVMGAVVPTYNLPGVTGQLKLTPDALSGIFLETIKRWNDPKIASANPGVALPDQPITTVHRSDSSGTTNIFTDSLAKVSADWKSKVGAGNAVNWPGGVGGKGNEGVAGSVKQTPYSVGYVELIYATSNKLGYAQMQNAKGRFVDANLDTVSKAAEGVTLAPDLRVSITNSDNAEAYPISGFTWILAYQEMADRAKALALTRYLWWSVTDGQAFTKELGYAPLPKEVVTKAQEKIRSMTSGGTKVLPAP
ncbi:MAG TPA: phosphate ABC transporter substrate-binding protein PstS [Candidatus Limnocylindria bacterium]|nr:phosphate ABC transporter substrate-binding protein PstS [Candidatus Limnocylindria bacterium]